MRKSASDIQAILNHVRYRDWTIGVSTGSDTRMYLQVLFVAKDLETQKVEQQRARKWYLSPWMTETEIVRTAFKAVQAAEMHEVEEHFTYHRSAIFSPHLAVRALLFAANEFSLDRRDTPKT